MSLKNCCINKCYGRLKSTFTQKACRMMFVEGFRTEGHFHIYLLKVESFSVLTLNLSLKCEQPNTESQSRFNMKLWHKDWVSCPAVKLLTWTIVEGEGENVISHPQTQRTLCFPASPPVVGVLSSPSYCTAPPASFTCSVLRTGPNLQHNSTTARIIGLPSAGLTKLNNMAITRIATSTEQDITHPLSVTSGWRHWALRCRAARFGKSLIPAAVEPGWLWVVIALCCYMKCFWNTVCCMYCLCDRHAAVKRNFPSG